MKFYHFFGTLILTITSFSVAVAQLSVSELPNEIDEICREKFPADGPGGAVLVAKGDQILYHKAFGLNNLSEKKPLEPGMIFRIGSVTKQFTATAILQLVAAEKMSLQDEITRFIPDYPTQGKTITIEQLLNHTSGIQSYTDMPEWTPEVHKQDFSPAGLIDFFKDKPMQFEPGTQFAYNNSGYILLGYIIEKVSGMSYADYLAKHVYPKAGLKHTYYETQKRPIAGWADGYSQGSDGYEPASQLSMTQPYAAGSLASTVEDLFRWTRAVHAGKVVSAGLMKKAHTPTILPGGENTGYGFGWIMGNVLGSPTVEHDGGIHGFLSSLIYLPNEEVCVAILTNCDCNSPGETAAQLAALAAGHALQVEALPLNAKQLEAYTGMYANQAQHKRALRVENGELISQRIGGATTKLVPVAKDQFRMAGTLNTLTFQRDPASGAVVGLSMDTRKTMGEQWNKTDEAMPEPPKELILNVEQLERLVGEYALAPGFSITVTREGTQLFGQGTGQPRFEMYAKSEFRFFLKAVAAEVEFFPNEKGIVDKMILFQNGMELPGKRMP